MSLPWDEAAEKAMKRVPRFVRPLARRKIEERVRAEGSGRVTLAAVEEAERRFKALKGGRTDKELAAMLPVANQPGAKLVTLEACRHELAGCPNTLLDLKPWREAVEEWLEQERVSERLRARVADERILFHHKLRIALAGCPNGCSRPQIADLALVGAARPELAEEDCIACGSCAEVCPDGAIAVDELARFDRRLCLGCKACSKACEPGAISLSPPWGRVFMGGKLGRHPHLAEQVGEVREPSELIARFDEALQKYLAESKPGERFAAWWTRASR